MVRSMDFEPHADWSQTLDNNEKVLVCCVELCSLHYQYGLDSDQIVSNALFADGAAAVVIGIRWLQWSGPSGELSKRQVPAWCRRASDAMTWRIGDNGYEMTLSAQVPSLIEQHLESFLSHWLASHGESIESIGGWAVRIREDRGFCPPPSLHCSFPPMRWRFRVPCWPTTETCHRRRCCSSWIGSPRSISPSRG